MALRGVERCEDHRLGRIVLYYRVLGRLQFLLQEWVIACTLSILLLLIIILKVTDNFFLLMLREHLNLGNLRLSELHPWINQYLLRRQSFQRICLQNLFENAQCAIRDVSR